MMDEVERGEREEEIDDCGRHAQAEMIQGNGRAGDKGGGGRCGGRATPTTTAQLARPTYSDMRQ